MRRPTDIRCVRCGEMLAHDGVALVHLDGGHIYGHVADPGDSYRADQRAAYAKAKERAVARHFGRTSA